MGKTSLLVNMALNISRHNPVLYFSFDLPDELLSLRFISQLAEIPLINLLHNTISEADKEKVRDVESAITKCNIHINTGNPNSMALFKSKCEEHIRENGVKLIIVDYLQLMNLSGNRNNSREAEVASVCRQLKNIAKDNNVCMLVSSQLSRAVEYRGGDKKPQLSDLRESGAIEEFADKVFFLYRAEYYGFTEDEQGNSLLGMADLFLAKNRHGKLANMQLLFDKDLTCFKDLEYLKRDFKFNSTRLDELEHPF